MKEGSVCYLSFAPLLLVICGFFVSALYFFFVRNWCGLWTMHLVLSAFSYYLFFGDNGGFYLLFTFLLNPFCCLVVVCILLSSFIYSECSQCSQMKNLSSFIQ